MVRAKGKANASTKRSVSKADAAVASEADTTLDSSEVENHIETGGSVEISVETAVNSTVVTEETMITLVEEEEENDGAETETLEGEHAMEEDEDNKENEVSGGGDEKCVSDKEEEDAISNDEGNNQENTIEQEDGEQIIDDQQVGDAAGVDKDNQEDEMPKQEDETNANEENKEKIEGEKNKEKIEGSLKQKAKKMKRRNNRKRKTNGSPQEKGENKQVMKKVASNGKVGKDLGKLESNDGEQSSKKVASGGKPRVVAQGKDEPESSHKKLSSKKKAKGMGMIFMCNSETKKDCYRYKVLGLPASKKEMVEKIYKGMRLFLYDVDLKLMYGIYKAAERGGYNIAPKAFKSQFPSQVRFSVLDDCLPLAEETFRQAIKKNYFTRSKFDCLLSSEQVKDLCKLFTAASKGSRSKDTRLGFETSAKSKRDRVKRRGRDGRRQAERARRPERVEERGYRQRVEERGYRQRVEEHGYREQVEERVYHERPQFHERDLVTSPLVPLAALQPLPPPAPVQSYAYSRTSRTDPYRRDTVIQHDDTYRQSRLVELPDAYRRDTVPCNPDVYRRQAVVEPRDTVLGNPDVYRRRAVVEPRDTVLGNPDVYRRQAVVEPRDTVLGNPDVYRRQAVVEPRDYYRQDGFPERREYHQPLSLETRLRDDIGINDPYVSYRERVSFRDPVNSARSEPEYDPPPVGLRSVYRHGGISTEYSTRSVLPEYPSSAASSLYEYPRQPQFRY